MRSIPIQFERDVQFPDDYTAQMRSVTLAAGRGERDAQFALGRMYEEGDGFPQNYAEARH